VRRTFLLIAAAAALAAGPAGAQVRPKPGTGDPRIQTIDYSADQVVLLQGTAGYEITIELSPDEQVENIAVGDSSSWQASSNRRGDHLFVKAIQPGVATNMTVLTNVRTYNFELASASGPSEVAYTVRFRYPPAAAATDGVPAGAAEGRYRLGGAQALRPSEISDDGTHTYIRWARERALPAVYALTETGKETLVNGMMRDDVFVIDSISSKLVFRIDNATATATRVRNGR
jgi:type IV secretion system protein VirB9